MTDNIVAYILEVGNHKLVLDETVEERDEQSAQQYIYKLEELHRLCSELPSDLLSLPDMIDIRNALHGMNYE